MREQSNEKYVLMSWLPVPTLPTRVNLSSAKRARSQTAREVTMARLNPLTIGKCKNLVVTSIF